MITMGVTGGIGSGKSTFCGILGSMGAHVFDADQVANNIMVTHPATKKRLLALLGAEAYLESGQLNKPFVAQTIFSDNSILRRVGQIVHPAVQNAFITDQALARKNGIQLFVREAALLPDNETRALMDVLVCVVAERELRIKRVMKRSHMTKAQVESRISAQESDEGYRAVSDMIVENNGSISELDARARAIWNTWVSH